MTCFVGRTTQDALSTIHRSAKSLQAEHLYVEVQSATVHGDLQVAIFHCIQLGSSRIIKCTRSDARVALQAALTKDRHCRRLYAQGMCTHIDQKILFVLAADKTEGCSTEDKGMHVAWDGRWSHASQ